MNDDAEAQEIHGTVVSSGRFPEAAAGERAEPSDRDEGLDPNDVEDVDDEDTEDDGDVTDPAGRAAVDREADYADDADDEDADDEVVEPDALIIVESDEMIAEDEEPGTSPVAGFARTPASSASATDGNAADADAVSGADDVPETDAIADAADVSEAGDASGAAVPAAGASAEAGIPEAARPGVPRHAGTQATGGLAGDSEQIQQRWSAIQASFVDDPRASVADAAELVSEAIAALVASVQEREQGLRGEWERDGADTEDLRNTLRGYRGLLDQLTELGAYAPLAAG